MSEKTWPEKLAESIREVVDEDTANWVLGEAEGIPEADIITKALWTEAVVNRLEAAVHDPQKRIDIMTRCCCRCADEHLAGFREQYKQHGDLDRLLGDMHGVLFLNPPRREGDTIYITKAPRRPDEYAQAETREDKIRYFCHCDYARASGGRISKTYCYCGAGWAKRIWEGVLDRPVSVEVVESVLDGDDACVLAVRVD